MKKIILFFFVFTVTVQLFAVTACPDPVTEKQPDGSEITFYVKGDERINWMESIDGYSLLRNQKGVLVYAMLNEQGDMIPSEIMAKNTGLRLKSENAFLANTQKKLFYSNAQLDKFKQLWPKDTISTYSYSKSAAVTETKALCILVETEDRPFTRTQEEFDRLLNEEGYNDGASMGSVKDFYNECTYGIINMDVTVVGPYRASMSMAYYADNAQALMREAVKSAFDDGVVFSEFDNDGDGFIDVVHVIFSGHGEEAGASNSIWSHKSIFYPTLSYSGIIFEVYSCSPELRGANGTSITAIGVIAHELGHVFGSPDYYDTDYGGSGGNYAGTGRWDLMANGSWNGSVSGGSPAHINMHQKVAIGWVTPTLLTSPVKIENMPNSAKNPVAYKIAYGNFPEHYLIENRQPVGFDKSLPGQGLIIYHVHAKATQRSVNNTSHPQQVYPVCASSKLAIPTGTPDSYGNINAPGCAFPGFSGDFTEFTDDSMPAMLLWNGVALEQPITDIIQDMEQNTVSFNFLKEIVSIDDSEKDLFDIEIYPNPAEDHVNIKLVNVEGDFLFTIYDINGRIINNYTWAGETPYNIPLHDFSRGIYFIRIITNNGEITKKLMVK